MPTSNAALAAVAALLSDVDPTDAVAVQGFFRHRFPAYPDPVRAIISDFVIASTEMPSAAELAALKAMVEGPLDAIPPLPSPPWDAKFGEPMRFSQDDQVPLTAGAGAVLH